LRARQEDGEEGGRQSCRTGEESRGEESAGQESRGCGTGSERALQEGDQESCAAAAPPRRPQQESPSEKTLSFPAFCDRVGGCMGRARKRAPTLNVRVQ